MQFLRKTLLSSMALIVAMVLMGFSLFGKTDYKTILPTLEMVEIPEGSMRLEVPIFNFVSTEFVVKEIEFKKPFKIGAYEVSFLQWQACYDDGGCLRKVKKRKGETDQHPVTRVSWLNAFNFTNWLAKKTGQKFRMPTEEEWTYAAFMGKGYKSEYVEYELNDVILAKPKISHVKGSFGKNAWGMHDIQGNVWEWTLSCWTSGIKSQSKISDPKKLNDPNACSTRFLWGEERAHIPLFVNTTYNGGCATVRPASNLGFRVMLESD